jgi:hypothetical protein
MYLNIFLVVLMLLALIFINNKIKNKSVIYFLMIILVFLCVKKFTMDQKEYFDGVEQIQQTLQNSVEEEKKDMITQKKITDLEETVEDLKEVLKKNTIKNSMIKDGNAKNFSLEESQKKQDTNLESLENELDILLRLYKKENEVNDEVKYKSLPIFSSCKVNDMGEMYKRDKDIEQENREKLIETLQKEELGKNLGIDSESGKDLLSMVSKQENGNAGNVDINFNLE